MIALLFRYRWTAWWVAYVAYVIVVFRIVEAGAGR